MRPATRFPWSGTVAAALLGLFFAPAAAADPLAILAWTTHADMGREYPNTVAAIEQYLPDALITEFTGSSAGELEAALAGMDAFLVPETEGSYSSQLRSTGVDWAAVLEAFAANGGSVVVCGEYSGRWGFLDATGLLEYEYVNSWSGRTFEILKRGHRLVRYVPQPTLEAVNATRTYDIHSGAALAVDANERAMLASRTVGDGWAVLVGYDFYDYDDDAARVLANAVTGPDDHWTWQQAGELEGAVKAYCLCETGDGLYAGTGPLGNVHFSSDGGQSWVNTANLTGAVHVFSLLPASDGSLIAGTLSLDGEDHQGRAFRSVNGGMTWSPVDLAGSSAVFCLEETATGVVLAGTSPGGAVFHSMDGGESWQGPVTLGGAESVDSLLALEGGDIYAGTGPDGDVFRSTDAGVTWTAMGDLPGVEHVYTLTTDGAGALIAGTAPGGCLWRSVDAGAGWTEIGCMAGTDFVSDLLTDSDGRIYAATGPYGDIYRSEDGGKTWRVTPNLYGVSQAFCLHRGGDGLLYVGTGLNGDVFVSGGAATIECRLECLPAAGTLPFSGRFAVTLENPGEGYRVAAGRIDVITAAGVQVTNWRAGYTILSAGEVFENIWFQPFPATGAVLGHNWFDLRVVDVTPVPYNTPPNPPSGDEDIDCATVRGMAPR